MTNTTATPRVPWARLLGALACLGLVSPGVAGTDKLTYHVDARRSGWNATESELTPQAVASADFGQIWSSPPLDAHGEIPPRLFATPLYVSRVTLNTAERHGQRHAVVFAATTTGFVYAISARQHSARPSTAPGTILWRNRLTERPCTRGSHGILSTPVIDRGAQRLYVAFCDDRQLWQATALDLRSGIALPGWPVRLDDSAVNAPGINRNGTNRFPSKFAHLQRAALNLSPDHSRLYVAFGGEPTSGWILSIDTRRPRVASAFAATRATDEGVGGMWAAGGPAIDSRGRLYMSTGSSVLNTLAGKGVAGVFPDSDGNWGQSVIELRDSRQDGFSLAGTYTPFDYCQTGARDMDLGSSSPALIDLPAGSSSTPRLLALGGGKQGNAYLLDRERMPGSLVRRQPCGDDASRDGSLLAPAIQPQFGSRGPLNVFGPYTQTHGMGDQARSRTTVAHFRNAAGIDWLYLTGSAKASEDSAVSVAPGLVRLEIIKRRGKPAYLERDRNQDALVLQNPGSPVISSHGARHAIVWVLDANKPRSTSLYGPDAPRPVLYALDAGSLDLLWQSAPGELQTSGKYNEPTIADGTVFIGTDRIQAFGLGARNPRAATVVEITAASRAPSAAPESALPPNSMRSNLERGRMIAAALYQRRCATCHESGDPAIPSRAQIAARPRSWVIEKLMLGSMQAQALGLSEIEITQLADYLGARTP